MNVSLSILDPDAAPLIDRAMHLSQQLRRYDPALAALLVKNESARRHTKRQTGKGEVVTRNGDKVKGGKSKAIDWNNPDIKYEERDGQH